nr:Sir2 family NAD-dependent protein deacetylase [Ferrimicrobium acidiphilum]
MNELLQTLDRLQRATIVAFTGAGLSTAAGIPDYRGPEGIWTKNPAASKHSRVSHYRQDPELRAKLWQGRLVNPLYGAQSTPGHHCLESLTRAGRLQGVITQNVDGLHRLSTGYHYPLIELHGCIHESRCLSCGDIKPMGEALERVVHGDRDPSCRIPSDSGSCGGVLASNTVTFGEPVPPARIEAAQALIDTTEVVLVLGSTLSVNPAARLVAFALEQGKEVVVVNQGPTRYDDRGVIKIHADCQQFLSELDALVSLPNTSAFAVERLSDWLLAPTTSCAAEHDQR